MMLKIGTSENIEVKYFQVRSSCHQFWIFCVCVCDPPGEAYCQLMDLLFPGCLDLSRVRFQSSNLVDFIHNYRLLQRAFRKVGVTRVSIDFSMVYMLANW